MGKKLSVPAAPTIFEYIWLTEHRCFIEALDRKAADEIWVSTPHRGDDTLNAYVGDMEILVAASVPSFGTRFYLQDYSI